MLFVVVNKMCAVSLVVEDTVDPDVAVSCRSLIGFEALLLLLLFVNLCLSQRFGLLLDLLASISVATTITSTTLRITAVAAVAAVATISAASLRAE